MKFGFGMKNYNTKVESEFNKYLLSLLRRKLAKYLKKKKIKRGPLFYPTNMNLPSNFGYDVKNVLGIRRAPNLHQ